MDKEHIFTIKAELRKVLLDYTIGGNTPEKLMQIKEMILMEFKDGVNRMTPHDVHIVTRNLAVNEKCPSDNEDHTFIAPRLRYIEEETRVYSTGDRYCSKCGKGENE